MRVSAASGSQSSNSLASPNCRRIFASLFSSMATSALPMALRNPSEPMKPLRGFASACAIRCSAPADLLTLFAGPIDELRLEIGFGGAEHLIAQALANPQSGFIGSDGVVN